MLAAALSVALKCHLDAMDPAPPMYITLNDSSNTVQVTMAGQTYLEDTLIDGPITWWQFKNEKNGTVVRSRLNRADGTLIITNEFGPNGNMIVKGVCVRSPRKF